MSWLPIDKETTQVYGTSNAGLTVLNSDEEFNCEIQKLAKELNLKTHEVMGTKVHTGVDCEGHRGKDEQKHMYLV
jgi:hypothetical protein